MRTYNIVFPKNFGRKEKFSKVSASFTFPAVTKKADGDHFTYYFAGDFNDYVTAEKFSGYLIAEKFNQIFSYDRTGDISNFYWQFYAPLARNILKETYDAKSSVKPESQNMQAVFRLANGKFEVKIGTEWAPFSIRGFNINAVAGGQPGQYTRDISVYHEFFSAI